VNKKQIITWTVCHLENKKILSSYVILTKEGERSHSLYPRDITAQKIG